MSNLAPWRSRISAEQFTGVVLKALPMALALLGMSNAEAATIAAVPTALYFETSSNTVAAGQCSNAVTVKTGNDAGAMTAVQTSLPVTPSGSRLSFFLDPGCKTKVSSITIPAGQSRANFYFSGLVATSLPLTVSAGGLRSASQSQTITSGSPTQVWIQFPPGSTASGAILSPALDVRVQDRYGNQVLGSNAPISIAIGAGSAAGKLSGTVSRNALQGRAMFNDLVISTAVGGSFTVEASSPGLSTFRSSAFSVSAGVSPQPTPTPTPAATPVALKVYTGAQTIAAGQCSSVVTVKTLSALGNDASPFAALPISLTGTGGLSFYADSACTNRVTSVTVASGQSQANFYFKGIIATSPTLTVSAASMSSASQTETVSSGPATQVWVQFPPTATASGAVISPALDVRVQDVYGNQVLTSSASITFTLAAGSTVGQLGGTMQRSATQGRALFSDLKISTATGGSFKLTASSPGLSAFTTAAFSVAPSSTPVPTPTPTPTPTPSPTSSVVQASIEGIEKPTPERGYSLNVSSALSLALSRNETTGRVLKVATTGCQAISASNLPSGVSVSLFHMPQVSTTTPSFKGGIAGNHYDPLVPLYTTSNQVCANETYIWADISVAATVAPGTYGFTIGGMPVSLKVWNLTMPIRPTMPLYIGLGSYPLLLGHNLSPNSNVSVQGPLTLSYVNVARAHRMEPSGQWIQNPLVNSDGTLNLDNWSTDNASFRQLVMNNAVAPVCVRSPGQIGYPWASVQELQGWERAVQSDTALSKAWAYITDEPTDIAGTAARAQLVRTHAPHVKTMVTTEPTSALLGLIDHFTVVFEFFKQPGHWQDYTQAPGYFLYGSCMSHGSCANNAVGNRTGTPDLMFDEPNVHARLFPLAAYMAGAEAALYYNTTEMYGKQDPWSSQYLFGGNGDGTLFYPGISGQRGFKMDEPVASIRMKAIRQGQYDVEYINLARKAGLTTNASILVPNQFSWSRNNSDYETLRQQIGDSLGQ